MPDHKPDWFAKHEAIEEERNSHFAKKEDIKVLVIEALKEFFSDSSKSAKTYLVGSAAIIAAITVILGGFKTLLAYVGFSYIK